MTYAPYGLEARRLVNNRPAVAAAAVLAAVLAACAGSAATATGPGVSATKGLPTATAVVAIATTAAPPATAAGPARCSVTPDASPSATIGTINTGLPDFDGEATIKAGQAVVFVMGSDARHTVTEGSYGEVAPNACVDVSLAINTSVVVTFDQPGVYQLTCKPHPVMQTTVTVE